MGESALAMRSYTHLTSSDTSHEPEGGDPIRALTASISFGKFMSESLDWGKWSSFSHNRHLEEAKKFSRPGSVAEKKAYFEAHYKKIAAAKKATALLEAANVANSNTVGASYITNQAHAKSSTDLEPTEASTVAVSCELEKAESAIEERGNLENSSNVENQDEPDNAVNEDKIVPAQEETVPVKGTTVLVTKKKQAITSSNSLASTSKSKLPLPAKTATPAQLRKDTTITSSKVKLERDPRDRKRKFPQSLHMSIKQDCFASTTNRKQEISSSKSLVSSIKSKIPFSGKPTIPVQPIKEANAISRSNNKSLNMSINEDTIRLIRNTKQENSSSRAKLPFLTKLTSPSQPKNEITATPRSEKAGGFVDKNRFFPKSLHMSINLSSHVSVTPKSETIRRDGNCTSTLSLHHTKSSTRCESKTRATTASSPFNFRSEERATKRKEKIEEKKNVTTAGKVQTQIVKEKAENDVRNLRQSSVSSNKTAADSNNHITTLPCNPRKILLRRLQSPKPGQKPITTNIIRDINYQPHRRPPMKNGGYDSRGKLNQSLSRSIPSLYKKKTRENASPSIIYSVFGLRLMGRREENRKCNSLYFSRLG